MSAFTFTAPIHTEDDDRSEWASLTEEERERYRSEVYGTTTTTEKGRNSAERTVPEEETPESVRNGLELLMTALDGVPYKMQCDYREALQQVPELVEKESPALAFLRATRYDAWAAARRLVEYWSSRKKVFGPDRAFRPMTLCGAMADDVPYLEKAVVYVLENDDRGRPVVFYDRMRCTKDVVPRDSAVRCFWYVLQTVAELPHHQRRGYVITVNYRGCDLYKHFDRILSRKFFEVVACAPVRVQGVHYCTGSGASVTRDLILPVLKHMAGKDNRLRLQLHAGSNGEILERFRDFGLGEVHVRAVFGGEGGNRLAVQPWLRERRRIEETQQGEVSAEQDCLLEVEAQKSLVA